MIRFACLCKHRIEVDADMAGGLTQCPHCGRLNDVPTLSDLPHLADDGTYRVEVEPPKDDPLRLAELGIVYAKGPRDPDGDEIDLRFSAGEVAAPDPAEAAADDADDIIPLKDEPRRPLAAPAVRPAPRNDPETGELIEQFDIKPDPQTPLDPTDIPMARATIAYATGAAARRVTSAHAAVELLMPINVAVMAFLFLAHVIFQFTGMISVTGLWIFGVIPLLILFLIIGHYGNVIDEIGPQDRDELPRPLRQCQLGDDLWQPFVNVTCALAVCFGGPVLLAMRARAAGLPPVQTLALLGLLVLLGLVVLPAVMLTTNTSGTVVNLRPDRLIGVMRTAGVSYAVSVGLGVLATVTYGFGIFAADMAFIRVLGGMNSPLPVWVHVVGYPTLAAGIYFAHLFCWHLGLIYREHHAQFPWAYQRHIPDPNAPHRRGLAAANPTGTPSRPARPRQDTRTKFHALREAERKRRAEQNMTDREVNKAPAWTKYLG
jgi:hypothetical protein